MHSHSAQTFLLWLGVSKSKHNAFFKAPSSHQINVFCLHRQCVHIFSRFTYANYLCKFDRSYHENQLSKYILGHTRTSLVKKVSKLWIFPLIGLGLSRISDILFRIEFIHSPSALAVCKVISSYTIMGKVELVTVWSWIILSFMGQYFMFQLYLCLLFDWVSSLMKSTDSTRIY